MGERRRTDGGSAAGRRVRIGAYAAAARRVRRPGPADRSIPIRSAHACALGSELHMMCLYFRLELVGGSEALERGRRS